jgi:hypothetical protein
MAEKIKIPIEVDSKDAVKDINSVNNALNQTSTESKQADESLEKVEKQTTRLGKAMDQTGKLLKKGFAGSLKLSMSGLQSFGNLLKGMSIGAGMKLFDTLTSGLMENQKVQDAMNKAMIVFQGTINGIIELAQPLFDWLNKAFTSPQDALKEFGKLIKEQLYNRFWGLIELLPQLGKSIGLLFEGKFSEAGQVALDAVAKVTLGVEDMSSKVAKGFEVVAKNTKKAFDLAPQIDAARKQTARLEILYQGIIEKYDGLAEKQRQLRDDERLTFEERIKANEQLKKELEEGQKKEEANINQRIKNKQKELLLNKNDISVQNEILALKQELIGVDSKYKGLLSEQKTNVVSLAKEERDAAQGVADAHREGQRAIIEARAETEKDELSRMVRERERIAQFYLDDKKRIDDLIANETEGTTRYYELLTEREQIESDYQVNKIKNEIETLKIIEDKKKESEEKEKERLEQLAAARLETTQLALNAVSDLFSENAEMGKAVAIAQAIIDTYTGATKALGQGGVLGYVGAGAIIATGFANIRKIMQTEIPGSDGGSYSDANASMSAPSGPNVGIISGQINSSAQLLGSLNNSLSTPPRAYVVGQDVNSQQSLDRHIRQNATL